MKIRIKYTLSITILIIITIMVVLQIPIQNNYVDLTKWILGFIFAGFSVKKVLGLLTK